MDRARRSARIAPREVPTVVSDAEPLLALLGGAMGPLLRIDPALRRALDPIVAHRGRRVEGGRDVRGGRRGEEAGVARVPGPDPGEAVGLQLGADRGPLRSGLGAAALAQQSEDVLDVVPVLVRHDVALGERSPGRAETGPQLLEEREIEVDLLVGRAVERPRGRRREAAAGLRRARVEHRTGGRVRFGAPRELVGPVLLDAVDEADDPAVVATVRVRAGLALIGVRAAIHGVGARRLALEGIHAEQQRGDEDDQAERASADDQGPPTAAAALVLDLRGIERLALVEAHAHSLLMPWRGSRAPPPIEARKTRANSRQKRACTGEPRDPPGSAPVAGGETLRSGAGEERPSALGRRAKPLGVQSSERTRPHRARARRATRPPRRPDPSIRATDRARPAPRGTRSRRYRDRAPAP